MTKRPTIGETIRRQRELSEVSMRQFADMAGIEVIFLDNIPRPHDDGIDLEALLRELADLALARGAS